MADQFNYIFQYPARVNALLDPIVGPLVAAQEHGINPLWVYDLRQGGVTALSGFWCLIVANYPNDLLTANPNLQFVVDRDLALQSLPSVVFSNVSRSLTENIQVVSAYGSYCTKGLINEPLLNYFGLGATWPIYWGPTWPSAFYSSNPAVTWFAWEAWDGAGRLSQITTYNHTTTTWTGYFDVGCDPNKNDSHGNPSIVRDDNGFVHCLHGPHVGVIWHHTTVSPDNPSDWFEQDAIVSPNLGLTYPMPVFVNGVIYLVVRDTTVGGFPLSYFKTTSLVNGISTWSSINPLFNGAGDANKARIYANCTQLRNNTEIHFIFTGATFNNDTHQNIYYAILDTTTGNVKNINGSHTTLAGALPVGPADMDTFYQVIAQPTPGGSGSSFALCFDNAGNPHVIFTDGPIGNTGTSFSVLHSAHINGSWTANALLGITNDYSDDVGIAAALDGGVNAYWSQRDSAGFIDGGNIHTAHRSVNGIWGTSTLFQAADGFALNEPKAISVCNPNARVLITEITQQNPINNTDSDTSVGIGTMKVYAYGDGGYLQRPSIPPVPFGWSVVDRFEISAPQSTFLTNKNLTFTSTVNAIHHQLIRSARYGIPSGQKGYFEILINAGSMPDMIIGISNYNFQLINGNYLGIDNNGIGYEGDAVVLLNGVTVATLANYSVGDIICVATDHLNNNIWWRINNGNWNNNAANDPSKNIGGISIAVLGVLTVFPTIRYRAGAGQSCTAKFAKSDWSFVAPSGFNQIS